MFLKDKIQLIHFALDELNYRPENEVDFEDFDKCAKGTIVRLTNFNELNMVGYYYNLVVTNWELIRDLVVQNHKLSKLFKELVWNGNDYLELMPIANAEGVVIATNILSDDEFKFSIFDSSNNWDVKVNDKNIYIDTDGSYMYILKPSNKNNYKLNIFDNESKNVLQITCNDDLKIYITNNHTNYELIQNEDDDYVSFIDTTLSEEECVIAEIFSDIADEEELKYGISQIIVHKDVDEKQTELIMLIAIASFLVINAKIEDQRNQQNDEYDEDEEESKPKKWVDWELVAWGILRGILNS